MHGRPRQRFLALIFHCCAWVWVAGTSLAQPPSVSGLWVLSADGVAGKCRILLRTEVSAAGGRQMTIPLICIRTFPLLGPVETWTLAGVDHLEFTGRSGQTVLAFAAQAGDFVAVGPQGLVYRLTPLVTATRDKVDRPEPEIRPAPVEAAAKERLPAAATSDAGGRYSMLRDGGKDTGCLLTLDDKGKGAGKAKASLAPGCRDQGIVIFDPAGWQLVNGRLELTARKGHRTYLDPQPDGTWKKDPAEGKTLSLKKM
ncbi:MAG: protease inhibitor Inh/omp19 family protein [Beijerinckiaceae bacterium]|nr:protease inhibitor Inh/omp19 family protein [Beijerinckiaceae bacterium]